MELSQLIKNYRVEHKLSLRRFADVTGLSSGYLSMLEKGRQPTTGRPIKPSLECIKQIARGMELPTDKLLSMMSDDFVFDLSNSDVAIISPDEQEILTLYRSMDDEAKERLSRYAKDLTEKK